MVEEGLQFLDLGFLEQCSFLWPKKSFIDSPFVFLDFLVVGLLLVLSDLASACADEVSASVHGHLSPGVACELEDCSPSPGTRNAFRRSCHRSIIGEQSALAVRLVHHGDLDVVELIELDRTVFWKVLEVHAASARDHVMPDEAASFQLPVVGDTIVDLKEPCSSIHMPAGGQYGGVEILEIDSLSS